MNAETQRDDAQREVRTPLFPAYGEVRHLLRACDGRPHRQVKAMIEDINRQTGTPQNPVDWTDPDNWISERLSGEAKELAETIWESSGKTTNPRYIDGHWRLCRGQRLIEEGPGGVLRTTGPGVDFLDNDTGDTVKLLDRREGLARLLELAADRGPARMRELLPDWIEYLNRHSALRGEEIRRDSLRRRLNNLIDRKYLIRSGALYSITDDGLSWLERLSERTPEAQDYQELRRLIKRQNESARAALRKRIGEMKPAAFERLVARLLESMGYRDVDVTPPSGDGGVDVVAEIEVGITRVKEVVQAKRYTNAVQRSELDKLRGSLYRFNAVRGTIVTVSDFAKGAKDAAFDKGAAPITLINGEKLIDLLIEHGIGVRKRHVEILALDEETFVVDEA